MSNNNLPIKPTDRPVTDAVDLPSSIDEHRIGFPVNILDKDDKRVIGTAEYYNGKVYQFRRGLGRFKTRPRYDLELDSGQLVTTLEISLGDLYAPKLIGTLNVLANGNPIEGIDEAEVLWIVTVETDGVVIFSQPIRGKASNQVLLDIGEWLGTITITAKIDDMEVTLVQEKTELLFLKDVITKTSLDGLQLPAWAI